MKYNKEYVFVTNEGFYTILKKVKVNGAVFYECSRKDALASIGMKETSPVFGNLYFYAAKFDKLISKWECLGQL